ncbi:hypothetical protein ACFE04_002513 [Oxalis oulophora]
MQITNSWTVVWPSVPVATSVVLCRVSLFPSSVVSSLGRVAGSGVAGKGLTNGKGCWAVVWRRWEGLLGSGVAAMGRVVGQWCGRRGSIESAGDESVSDRNASINSSICNVNGESVIVVVI